MKNLFKRDILVISEVSDNPKDPYKNSKPADLTLEQLKPFPFNDQSVVAMLLLVLDFFLSKIDDKDQIAFEKAVKECFEKSFNERHKYVTKIQ